MEYTMKSKLILLVLGILLVIIGVVLIYLGFAPVPSLLIASGYILIAISLIPEKNNDDKKEKK